MELIRLEKVEAELRHASQSLWDFRMKDCADPAVDCLLSSSQDAIVDLIQHVAECRKLLETREQI